MIPFGGHFKDLFYLSFLAIGFRSSAGSIGLRRTMDYADPSHDEIMKRFFTGSENRESRRGRKSSSDGIVWAVKVGLFGKRSHQTPI